MNKRQRKLMVGSYIVLGILVIALAAFSLYESKIITQYSVAYNNIQSLTQIGNYDSAHEHADFLVYVNGQKIDFTKPEYQEKHSLVHVEEPEIAPHVIHTHATGITYGTFFPTLGVAIDDCLTVNEKQFCDANGRLVKYYLNGQLTPDLANHVVVDLDKVLISYGSESVAETQAQLKSIGNLACVQSNKC